MSVELAYLSGLVIGRGKIYKSGRIVIEFPHPNEFITGLARCPTCRSACAKSRTTNTFICKNSNCERTEVVPIETRYYQKEEVQNSLIDFVIPFLSQNLVFRSQQLSNPAMTLLILDFDRTSHSWNSIVDLFGDEFDFHYGLIPNQFQTVSEAEKIEFVNGLLDAAGFCNKGNQQGERVARDGSTTLRQRVYIQIVRNWHIVVQIDNYLRHIFSIPIQTIRWAHPNLDDGKLKSVNEGKYPEREHQIKIHPEYMRLFRFRISHKQSIFLELVDHNLGAGFQAENWIDASKKISLAKMTPNHPMERNPRFPLAVQKHFDASWQINLALGCPDMIRISESAIDASIFALTGDLQDSRNFATVLAEIQMQRDLLNAQFPYTPQLVAGGGASSGIRADSARFLEVLTYPLLVSFFDDLYFQGEEAKGKFYEIATSTLSSFANGLPAIFGRVLEVWDDYKIHVDVVGYDRMNDSLIIIESKIESITLEMLGQLLGYCLVSLPDAAYLISTESPTTNLISAISAHPEVLTYGAGKKISIGKLDRISGLVTLYDF